jgi:beta-ureidopropionase / N-carbamoyl-L-amino-acid hydrolase
LSFAALWASLLPVGRDPETGGYRRYSWTAADLACRDWFRAAAADRGLAADEDRNGNLWAWWPAAGVTGAAGNAGAAAPAGAIVTGSHLDSVPDGGAYDGPLGIISAFAAIDLLRGRGFGPARPIAVAAFTEEEGARFGVACLGSRLSTGAIAPDVARELRDGDGVSLAQAMTAAGRDPAALGPDEERLAGLAAYVELHIEQGSALAGLGAAVGVAAGIWPHGRWHLEFIGRADHAGTTRISDRRDPMLPYAAAVLAARQAAVDHGALATFGKVIAEPGGANGISSAVHAWLDARAPDAATLDEVTGQVRLTAQAAADEHHVRFGLRRESLSPPVSFDPGLRDRIRELLERTSAGGLAPESMAPASMAPASMAPESIVPDGTVPVLPTGAGHDAGVLAVRLPAAMLFVRNPSGTSHSPAEYAEPEDCQAGVAALAAVLADLASS